MDECKWTLNFLEFSIRFTIDNKLKITGSIRNKLYEILVIQF